MVKFTATSWASGAHSALQARMQFHRERQFLPELFSTVNRRNDATLANTCYGCASIGNEVRRQGLWSLRRGEGTGYIGIRRLQVRLLPAARAAVAQWIERRTNTWADDSRRRKFAEWRRHELLRTTVAGSSPASGASCCSSIGRAKLARAASSLCKKDSGVVKVRVTSTKSVPVNTGKDCGQGTPPVPQGTEAQTNSRGPIVPTG
jgi:hypothetical protein